MTSLSQRYMGHIPTPDPNQSLTVTLKALDALKHIFQSDVIIIDNEGFLFIWETYPLLANWSH